jgi:RHS repeat-associated protein
MGLGYLAKADGPTGSVALRFIPDDSVTNDYSQPDLGPIGSATNGGTVAIAEANTPEITALARGLENDPQRIFAYVHDRIRFEYYFGSRRGAQVTMLEGAGNDFDQCALLVALLRAASYTNVTYQFGTVTMPYDTTNTAPDFKSWLGLTTNGPASPNLSFYLLGVRLSGGIPYLDTPAPNLLKLHRVWVKLSLPGTNYFLDPAYKPVLLSSGVDLDGAMGLNASDLLSATGGAATTNGVSGLSYSGFSGKLRDYTTNLVAALRTTYPNASVEQVVGGPGLPPPSDPALSQPLPFTPDLANSASAKTTFFEWTYIPTNLMSHLTITLGTSPALTNSLLLPDVRGRRLSLTFDSSSVARLWLDDTNLLQGNTPSTYSTIGVTTTIRHLWGEWDWTNQVQVQGFKLDTSQTPQYWRTSSSYVLLLAFRATQDELQARQNVLATYRQRGLSDTSREVVTETLNVAGLTHMAQTEATDALLAGWLGVAYFNHQRFGRMAQEPGRGYYVDLFQQSTAHYSRDGRDGLNVPKAAQWFDLSGFFLSAAEHGTIEQLQESNLVAASTVKMLYTANSNGLTNYLVTSSNWTSGYNVSSHLTNYGATTSTISYYVGQGFTFFLPSDGSITLAGAGSWRGQCYIQRYRNHDSAYMGYIIQGGYNGGYVSLPSATIDPLFIWQTSFQQPSFFNPQPVFTPPVAAADPVNMASGAFTVNVTDLAIGGDAPRGIAFSRHYDSSRRNHNLAGLGYGWTHNYACTAQDTSAPLASLGAATAAQAAPMLVAIRAALTLYQDPSNPGQWGLATLVAKWGTDQTISNAVSVNLGQDIVQFIKQPDGSFTPPGNCTMTLSKANGAYNLQERHGRTFHFDSHGRLTNIVDQYSQPLNLTYGTGATSNLVATVTDWKQRSLTFTYTGSPLELAKVADNTGRTVFYGYTTASGQTNLTSVADPEQKTNTFLCDTNHQIIATKNALGQTVVSNIYNSFGQVTTQFTQGDPAKMWQIFWSDRQTVEQDPAGSKRRFFFDDKHRPSGVQDALSNLSLTFYDGQDHAVMTVSPLNETNQTVFDANHNPILSIDALGFTNQNIFDPQNNNLIETIDARGNPTYFGYNAQFSLTGVTNGAGDWFILNWNSDGTPHTRTDSGGTTTFGSDANGYPNLITYPGGLGSEGFLKNAYGDVLTHTNARGFATSFQYNQRRQLTNTIAPTNLVSSAVVDAVGNIAATKDPRGFSTSNAWSVTRKLLTTTLPAAPAGAPVIGNGYDNRDWLVRSTNALIKITQFGLDLAGQGVSVTDPLQRATLLGHDPDGRTIATTNAALEVTQQQYSRRGEPTVFTDQANHNVLRAFDRAGNQSSLTNRNGKGWIFQSDAANRVTNTIPPTGRATGVVFNDRGLPFILHQPSGNSATNYYDALKRLTNHSDSVATTLFGLDGNGNITSVSQTINSQQSSINFAFDAYDQMTAFTNADGYVIQYQHDNNGNVTVITYPGNRSVTNSFDSLNQLTNVTDWAGHKTTIDHDLAGHVTKITRPNGSIRIINYDADGEVTNIIEKLASNFPIAFFTLNWNTAGRIAWEFAAPLPHTNALASRTMTFNDDNSLATVNSQSVTNDPDGNMVWGPGTNGYFGTYTFNARNWLSAIGSLTMGYDPAGNRTSIADGTNIIRFVINPNAALPQVFMRIRPGVTNYYIYGPGLLYEITETATSTNTLTYHSDYRGSTVALTDGNGLPTDRIEYSAYGLTTYRSGTNDTPFLYNGRYGVMTDPNGLLYMRARYYNPYICRFINADPSGFSGGLNFYVFANGNPISNLDPFGLGAVGESGGGSWIDQALQGTALGDWANGFSRGLQTWAEGKDVNYYTWSGSDAYLSGISSGYSAVPALVDLAAVALTVPTGGESLEVGAVIGLGRGAAEGGAASSSRWIFQAGTSDLVIDNATARAVATLDRYGTDLRFSSTPSEFGRLGWTRFDLNKVTLFPSSDVTTLIEEAHHIETAGRAGFLGERIADAVEAGDQARSLEQEWERYAESIGLIRKR